MALSDLFESSHIQKLNIIDNRIEEINSKARRIVEKQILPERDKSLYFLYPYLFEDYFEGLTEDVLLDIATAGALYSDIILFYDKWQDNDVPFNIQNVMDKTILAQECIKILCNYFENSSPFWKHMESYTAQYMTAVNIERSKHHKIISRYDQSEIEAVLSGKSAIAKTTVAAMAFLTGKEAYLDKIEKSQDSYAYAFQLFDDMRDWKYDLEMGQYTCFITDVLIEFFDGQYVEPDEFLNVLYEKNLFEKNIRIILEYCDKALLDSEKPKLWIKLIKMLHERANSVMKDIINIKNQL